MAASSAEAYALANAVASLSVTGVASALSRANVVDDLYTTAFCTTAEDYGFVFALRDAQRAEIVRALIAHDPTPSAHKWSVLLVNAAREGCGVAVAEALLEAGAGPAYHRPDDNDNTALHAATTPAVVRLLVAAGAGVNAANKSGTPPLHYATSKSLPVVEALLEVGADVNVRNALGYTPLYHAVHYGCAPGVVRRLLEGGADPTLLSFTHETPLARVLRDIWYVTTWLGDTSRHSKLLRLVPQARLLARATAWRRRRHMLLAIQGRRRDSGYGAAPAARAAVAAPAAAAVGAATPASGVEA